MVGAGMVSRAGERTYARGHSTHTNDCHQGLMPSRQLNGSIWPIRPMCAAWMKCRTSDAFDRVIDFDAIVHDPEHPAGWHRDLRHPTLCIRTMRAIKRSRKRWI